MRDPLPEATRCSAMAAPMRRATASHSSRRAPGHPVLNRNNSRLATGRSFLTLSFKIMRNAGAPTGASCELGACDPEDRRSMMNATATAYRSFNWVWLALVLAVPAASSSAALAQGEVNIYSYREPQLIDPLLKAFVDQTGIKTNIVYASAGLNERLAAEAHNSPADLLFTVDAGRLSEAKDTGLTQALESSVLQAAIPAQLRDPDGHWFGLTMRARIVYASRERVAQDAISYEELADPKWKGKVCMRSGQHVYNTSLIATLIAHNGEEATEAWLRSVKDNLAHKPAGGDREQARDIYSGKCDIALGNTYYLALLAKNDKNSEQQAWANAIRPLFPDAAGRGTHINISGIALTKHAPNKANAVALMEFLASEKAQLMYASANNEYPVHPKVAPSEIVQSWGTLKPDPLPLENIAKYRKRASELVDKVNFDAGPSS